MEQHDNRILFLKQFTKEMIIQSKPFIYEQEQEKIGEGEFIPLVELTEKTEQKFLKPQKPIPVRAPIQKSRYRVRLTEPMKPRRMLETRTLETMQPSTLNIRQQFPKPEIPMPEPTGEIISLGKLNYLIQDPRVTVIECPGPEKFILAKTTGQPAITKTSLNSHEIKEIIENFSQRAKIPIIPGLFKAAVGNLIITAVISELVGSRFILTKMNPQFMFESRAFLFFVK